MARWMDGGEIDGWMRREGGVSVGMEEASIGLAQ